MQVQATDPQQIPFTEELKICIVSKGDRCETFGKKTFRNIIKNANVDLTSQCSLWLQTPETFEEHLKYGIKQYLLPAGLRSVYNEITKRHAQGQRIVILHDDVGGIKEPSAILGKTKQVEDCGALFQRVFEVMEKEGAKLGGLYGSLRNMPRDGDEYTLGLQMIFDPVTFLFNQKSIVLKEEFDLFLDIHRMLEFHRQGFPILRMNKVGIDTVMNKTNDDTGFGFRTQKMWADALPALLAEYRSYISGAPKWKTRWYSFSFKEVCVVSFVLQESIYKGCSA